MHCVEQSVITTGVVAFKYLPKGGGLHLRKIPRPHCFLPILTFIHNLELLKRRQYCVACLLSQCAIVEAVSYVVLVILRIERFDVLLDV